MLLGSIGHRPVRASLALAGDLYEAAQEGRAADTHRNALSVGKAWGRFCVRKRWIKTAAFADVEPVGRKRRGAEKSQLRSQEARRLLDVCLDLGDAPAVACALAILLGLRASEIAAIQARDVDGDLLWVAASKTDAGRRVLRIPEALRPALLELAADRLGPILLDSAGKPATRWWVAYHVRRLCRAARVPVVSPHALRRTHATLATDAGATGDLVAAQLGHTSSAITRQAYIAPAATDAARGRSVETALGTRDGKAEAT